MADPGASLKIARQLSLQLVQMTEAVGMVGLDREGLICLWNSGAERLSGYSRAEVEGHHFEELLRASPAETGFETGFRSGDLQEAKDRGAHQCHAVMLCRDGRLRTLSIQIAVVTLDEHASGYGLVLTDATASPPSEISRRPDDSLLSELQENSGLGSFEVDLATWTGQCSARLCHIYGFANDEPFRDFKKFCRKYVHPEDLVQLTATREQLLKAGGTDEIEYRYQHPDGRERILWVHRRVVHDALGRASRLRGTVEDITERKHAEARLLASETRYRTLLDHATDAFLMHARGGVIVDANPWATESLGYTREELIGQLPTLFAEPLTPEKLQEVTSRLDSGQTLTYESKHRRKDGSTFPVEVRIRPFWLENQRCSITMIRDLSQQKLAEQALRDSEERYRVATETVHLGTWSYNGKTGRFLLDSRSQSHWGVAVPDPDLSQLLSCVHPDDREKTRAALLAVAGEHRTGESQAVEHRVVMSGGAVRWISLRAIGCSEDASREDRFAKATGTTLDITAPRTAALAIQGQNRVLERIATGAPLPEVLDEITRLIEKQIPDSFCSILMLDRDGQVLKVAAASRLPKAYNDAIDGIRIGPDVGSCGTAAWSRQSVLTADIQADARWANFRSLAAEHGLRSCWSVPIFAAAYASGRSVDAPLVGTFAVYRRFPGSPDRRAQLALASASHLAGVAVGSARAVQEIRDSEARYAMISQITRSVTFGMSRKHGQNWSIDWARPRFGLLSGYSKEEMAADSWTRMFPAEDQARLLQILDGLAKGESAREEMRILTKTGETLEVQVNASALPSADEPDTTTVIGGLLDISQFKAIEKALRQSEDFLRRAQLMAHVGSWTFSLKTRVFSCSEESVRIYGLTSTECSQADWQKLVHPDDLARITQAFLATLEGAPFEQEYRLVIRGKTKWVSVKASLESDAAGHALQVMGVTQDFSARRRLEEQLRHSQKMEAFGQLAGGVAHDFNNLLTVINGFSEVLLSETEQDDSRWHAIQQIREAGERAAVLTRQLLTLSRRQFTEPRVLGLNELVARSESMLSRLIGENISIETRLEPRLPSIKADPGQIDQVLLNLVVNARDAMPEGGRLLVATRRRVVKAAGTESPSDPLPGEYVELLVSDTGTGMTDETKSRIYEPFFSTKGVGKGTGLGLATVYGIIQQNHGYIEVESFPFAGTTFRILWPVSETGAPFQDPGSSVREPVRGTETILLAEDEPLVRQLAVLALKACGYRVIEADSGETALRLGSSHPADLHLLMTDVVMPGISGTELARRLRVQNPGLRVLYVSGYTNDIMVQRGEFTVLDDFLQKPFTPAQLARKVQQLLNVKTETVGLPSAAGADTSG